MREVVFIEPGRLEWRDVPEPTIDAPRQALVRPLAVATCRSDGVIAGNAPPFGLKPGWHEFVAEVIETGDEVESFRAGDRVVVPFQISCGACDACREGRTGNCTGVPPHSMYGLGPVGGEWAAPCPTS